MRRPDSGLSIANGGPCRGRNVATARISGRREPGLRRPDSGPFSEAGGGFVRGRARRIHARVRPTCRSWARAEHHRGPPWNTPRHRFRADTAGRRSCGRRLVNTVVRDRGDRRGARRAVRRNAGSGIGGRVVDRRSRDRRSALDGCRRSSPCPCAERLG